MQTNTHIVVGDVVKVVTGNVYDYLNQYQYRLVVEHIDDRLAYPITVRIEHDQRSIGHEWFIPSEIQVVRDGKWHI